MQAHELMWRHSVRDIESPRHDFVLQHKLRSQEQKSEQSTIVLEVP